MTRRANVASVLVLFAVITGITALHAVWEENGVLITGVPGDEYDMAITETIGDGGIIVAWRDERTGGPPDIYAARLDPDGNLPWTAGGVPVCTATGTQSYQMVVPDGAGGAIVAWQDERGPAMAIFAQRLDPDGNPLWAVNGDSLFTEINGLQSLLMTSDGAGGAIVLWSDYRFGSYDIIGQRIDENGDRLWGATGQPMTNLTDSQFPQAVIPAGGGEFILAYRDNRSGNNDLYAQKFDLTGAVAWGATGAAMCTDPSSPGNIALVADGAGGAIIVWTDYRTGDEEVFVQKVDQWGNGDWAADGVAIADGIPTLGPPTITTDTEGGAIIGFVAGTLGAGMDIHTTVQRIDADGDILWWPGGILASTGSWPTYSECICPDGEGGAIVLMYDFRDTDQGTMALYAQKIDHDGTPRWTAGGRKVTSGFEDSDVDRTYMTSDLLGGAYCVWSDDRNADFDLFGSRINMYGGIGPLSEPPVISSVSDVPNDQGGRLMLRWMASEADTFPEAWIDSYSAWRLLPGQMAASSRAMPLAEAGPVEDLSVGAVRHLETAAGEAWELVGYIPARQAEEYALMVESLFDSMGTDPGWQYFVVTAHMEGSILYFDSPVDSGYSVDNLSPAQPVAFGGIQSLAPPGLNLYWDAGTEADLSLYEVYKGATEDFVPGGLNFVGSIFDTEFLDAGWTPADQDFFKLIAVDVHGNRGPAATLRPENIYVGTLLQSWSASWTDSWVELNWTLSQADDGTEFHVLRAENPGGDFEEIDDAHLERDGMSFTVKDRTCEPGVTYLYRIEVEESGGRRILFESDEIEAPAMPLTLYQNVPNPFNPSTSIAFYLPERSHVRIDVYDVTGRLVTTLTDGIRSGGSHTVEWNGSDSSGRTAASGVYFYRLTAEKFEQTKKMILLR